MKRSNAGTYIVSVVLLCLRRLLVRVVRLRISHAFSSVGSVARPETEIHVCVCVVWMVNFFTSPFVYLLSCEKKKN